MKQFKREILVVVIPTYNEADNIEYLIKNVKNNISPHDHVVIVDDDSPDKTGRIAKNLKVKFKNLHVIIRKGKNGRGSAVIDGFKYALDLKPTYFVEMDADFSHKPEDIPRLRKLMAKNVGMVIGSRYMRGSRIQNWPLKRKIFSHLANLYAKTILQIPISDYTNGFRLYSKNALEFLLSQDLKTKGYIVLSETAYKLHRAGFKFEEIPIVFINRKRGVSNVNRSEIKNAFFGVLKIRWGSH